MFRTFPGSPALPRRIRDVAAYAPALGRSGKGLLLMRKLACLLLGIAMATGVLVGLSATEAVAPKAEAANYVSRLYTAPKYGQTGNHIVALQRRPRAGKVLTTEEITGYYGDRTR